MLCPICDKSFEPAQSNALPFCGERCRTIDLGRWLGETYGMPVEPEAEVEGVEPLHEDDAPNNPSARGKGR